MHSYAEDLVRQLTMPNPLHNPLLDAALAVTTSPLHSAAAEALHQSQVLASYRPPMSALEMVAEQVRRDAMLQMGMRP